ncbi:cytosolic endo-beta-N-acetylglucosaminidase 1 isoform X2 [Mercurialis annua]|uniref:cytosolic endo-beta-N-acetylglucosaminidase 1 isoform X2 n=1 Tax=Mercurialis annua TaxID=3986 RepID=UPI00215FC10D|nr:cytosolic endo-beta-N-acetylglucosaminidase 1 isoform X2 [Mercurialis annua]
MLFNFITSLLRAHINRKVLIFLHNFFTSIHKKIQSLCLFTPMSQPHQISPFDPQKPSKPISYPIKTLEELNSRAYFESFHYPFNKASVLLPFSAVELPHRPRLLVCHDLQGGYGDDKWVQGGFNGDAYGVWHWHLIDVFVYFSHALVNLPPPCWTNAAHKHGVKVLGTFLTEWEEGRLVCNKLLETEESARMYAERLSELAIALGFDGWLINMEINLDVEQIPNLKEFVSHLTKIMHSSMPGSLVIWYDAVTVHGKLDWQDQLNENNKPFFDICDGIFVNYTWKKNYPAISAALASDRKFDVYTGIDIFGRNTYGGGQWNTKVALEVLKKESVSAAIFAPGWVYETNQPPDFRTAQNRWWELVEQSWGMMKNHLITLPFYSNFDQGYGNHISIEGNQVTEGPWNNLSCQGFQPFLEFIDGPTPEPIRVLVDVKEASYDGGGNITFRGFLDDDAHFTKKIFQGKLILGYQSLQLQYSVKSEGNSVLGLSFQFSSNNNEKTSLLIASSNINHISHKFTEVIIADQVKKPEIDPGWVIYEGSIAMNDRTLSEIHAVCYRLKPEHSKLRLESDTDLQEDPLVRTLAEYFSVLGHIVIKDLARNSCFFPSRSWLVEGQNIKFSFDSQESRLVSLNIIWKLKNGNDFAFPKYNIYVEELEKQVDEKSNKRVKGAFKYLGVAQVPMFYVSDLYTTAATYSLKFIVQACDLDGTCQKLDDSPNFRLDFEGQ